MAEVVRPWNRSMSSAPRGSPGGRRADRTSAATRSAAVQSSRARSTSAGSSGSDRTRSCTAVKSSSIRSRTARYASGRRGSPSSTKSSSGVPASTRRSRSRWVGSIWSRWRAATSWNDAVTSGLSRYPVNAEMASGRIAIVMPSAIQERRDRSFQPRTLTMRRDPPLPAQLLERGVPDPVALPVLVVEVPPFGRVDGEPLRLHRAPKELPEPALARGPSGIGGIGAARHLVVHPRHLDRVAALELVEGEIHGAAPVVARAGGRVGHELVLGRRRRVPEHLRDVPGAIRIVDEEAVAHRPQLPLCPHQRLRRGALHEGPGLAVQRCPEEVPGGGIADVEPDGGIELHQLHQVGLPELPALGGRLGGERFPAELLDRPRRHDPEDRALLGPERTAGPERIPDRNGARPAAGAEAEVHP